MKYPALLALAVSILLAAGAARAQHDNHQQLGEVHFPVSCDRSAQEQVEVGVAQLHHMMYEQARPPFERAAEADAGCAMAHWGIAMTSFQPLWQPTSDTDLERGRAAVQAARDIGAPTDRERRYIAAVEAFFTDPDPPAADRPADHEARVEAWRAAQRALHEAHPDDVDAAAFYGLSQVAYALTQFSPDEEHDYERERRAGALLERYFERHPNHPGLHHYLIHAYDSPALADRAEAAAERYDRLAPTTPHALHMPSHIFVRLGRWEETIEWNQRSAETALQHAATDAHALMHYVHALDYMMYGYLQLGAEEQARDTLARVRAMDAGWPVFASAYGIAASQARYYLEQQKWEEAARLEPGRPDVLPWDDFPAGQAIFHYARGLGAARSGDLDRADVARARIGAAVTALRAAGDEYWAYMTEALGMAVEAWTLYERGETDRGLRLMREAADLEDSMDKHPISPGEILPVRELYGELLLRDGRQQEARAAFEASLERTPNRRNALEGLKRAAAS